MIKGWLNGINSLSTSDIDEALFVRHSTTMITTTLKLDKGPSVKERFAFCDIPPQPPRTPGQWFAARYPAEVQRWGAPMLEAVVADQQGNHLVQPLTLNDNFFAAIISDARLGHSVVFYQPEQQWFYLDPVDQHHHAVEEAKLVVLLSALISRCASEMPTNVDLLKLFHDMRDEEVLKPIVKRARAIHSADSTFFDKHSSHKRVNSIENHAQIARRFVRTAVKREPTGLLPIGECYQRFSEYCANHSVEAVHRNHFKKLIVEVIREEFGLGLRGDIRNTEDRCQRGWKGLAVENCQRN